MERRQFSGLILDFIGVLTSNMVEVIELFEARERIRPGTFLRAWADPRGKELYRALESGEIDQHAWNLGFGALMQIDADNLMGRLLYDMYPAHEVMRVARQARSAGIRTAVLSNSLGRSPFDPYALHDLSGSFDVVVMSAQLGIRKPDPAIFVHTLEQLGVPARECVFADDSEENLPAASKLGMTVIHALDEQITAANLRSLLGLPSA